MMKHISVHAYTVGPRLENLDELGAKRIPHKLKQILDDKDRLDKLIQYNRDYVFGSFLLGKTDPAKLKASLQLILQSYWTESFMQVYEEDTVPVRLGDQTAFLPPYVYKLHFGLVWEMAFYYSFICRASKLQQHLRELNYAHRIRIDAVYDDYKENVFEFFRSLGTEQEMYYLDAAEWALNRIPQKYTRIHKMYFPLWRPALTGDADGFNATLEQLLESHKAYWGGPNPDDPDIQNDGSGHRNVQLTAIMSFAHDKGIPIALSSDYTPRDLVEGKYEVDIDTPLDFYYEPKLLQRTQEEILAMFAKARKKEEGS